MAADMEVRADLKNKEKKMIKIIKGKNYSTEESKLIHKWYSDVCGDCGADWLQNSCCEARLPMDDVVSS
jgi:hypothetical protein